MLKQEFEKRIGKEISSEEYKIVERVYEYYPGIEDKDDIAGLYRNFGMMIIEDMYNRAERIRLLIERLNKQLLLVKEIEEKLRGLGTHIPGYLFNPKLSS